MKKHKRQKTEADSESQLTPFQQKMREKLEGSRFRWINEQLYTSTSDEAADLFKDSPALFEEYHKGFARQVQKWPQNPLNLFISDLKKCSKKLVVGDFGCGEAKLAASVKQQVHSFDLVAANDRVVVCDIASVPLPPESLDVAVFCLSLMGSNYVDYLAEAHRVLKPGGMLKIAEVTSRVVDMEEFCSLLRKLGFDVVKKNTKNSHFVIIECDKSERKAKRSKKEPKLKACLYRRR